ncbi:MAG: type I glyceraldehyde-3-phosphate dehydrogenase [Candidatus Liptonbacteria bacterium RIFCSPLOWO2_01_FULL_52_25]|uniref:Type I glyceraldehyde-3-phosphate dehydrogenase n=1 Tax=Candidatus Liptonbacteria bacterium RIFCSPLOWO2_01_FULL_52_25 TaxID=1798650 RepID=A0A1G2CH62_9BACT|nr:MAG: type I glyceraldehyde-3-phosphate dehydrogenase [Candidatus Liptonbacteria bacterium RIFCSPLOWO2_01_FULL_52_25]
MQSTRVAINGFGRIGRLFFRQAFGVPGLDIVAVNDVGDLDDLAYLLAHDSVYRKYEKSVEVNKEKHALVVDGKEVAVLQEKDPGKLPWKKLTMDIVVESTGFFESFEQASAHIAAGAKRVVLTAPAKDAEGTSGGRTVLMGVNDSDLGSSPITSNASCTTNSASPIIQILSENPGILKATLSTVHAYTATQSIVDGPSRGSTDFRRGRSAPLNIAPSTTGAAIAVTRAVPELVGKFDGLAFRVPVPDGSLSDITFLAKRKTSVEEVNQILTNAAALPRWQGILKVTREQLVSSDIIGEPYGAIVDLGLTKVIDGDLVKVLSWYDNEAGYVSTLVKHVQKVAELL